MRRQRGCFQAVCPGEVFGQCPGRVFLPPLAQLPVLKILGLGQFFVVHNTSQGHNLLPVVCHLATYFLVSVTFLTSLLHDCLAMRVA